MFTLFNKILFIFIALGLSFRVLAEGKKLYTENEFLDAFGAKSKERVLQILGIDIYDYDNKHCLTFLAGHFF